MTSTSDKVPEKLGRFPFVLGGISFIPLLGVLFGAIAIVWGLATKKQGGRRLAALGAGGIGFTIVAYGALFFFGFVQRGGIYDDLRAKLALTTINSLVPAIEFYKLQHGSYPASLQELRKSLPKESMLFIYDPTDVRIGSGEPRPFYYERVGDDHYYLRGVGADGQPFTADDILPQVELSPEGRLGLLLDRKP